MKCSIMLHFIGSTLFVNVLLQTVKTQMKCSIMLHFIRVYTVCKGKNDLKTKEYNIFANYNLTTLDMYNGLSQVVSKQEESISIQRVKMM